MKELFCYRIQFDKALCLKHFKEEGAEAKVIKIYIAKIAKIGLKLKT
jgi:hypothetical protein